MWQKKLTHEFLSLLKGWKFKKLSSRVGVDMQHGDGTCNFNKAISVVRSGAIWHGGFSAPVFY